MGSPAAAAISRSMFHRAPGSIAVAFPRGLQGMRMGGGWWRSGHGQEPSRAKVMPNTALHSAAPFPAAATASFTRFSNNGKRVSNLPTIDIKTGTTNVGSVSCGRDLRLSVQGASRSRGRAQLPRSLRQVRTRPGPLGSERLRKKPFPAEGARARQGGDSAIHRHGGTIFGPRPRDYSYKRHKDKKAPSRRALPPCEGRKFPRQRMSVDERRRSLRPEDGRHRRRGRPFSSTRWTTRTRCWLRATPEAELRGRPARERYDVVNSRYIVLSQSALDRLTEASAMNANQIIRRRWCREETTLREEKKSSPSRWMAREQDPGQERVSRSSSGEGRRGPPLQRPRQDEADGSLGGQAPRLAQGLRPAQGRRESAGLHRRRLTATSR